MIRFLEWINQIVWGVPTLLLILGVGLYIGVRTRFAQVRLLPCAIRSFLKKFRKREASPEDASAYRALCTALAATVGIGNVAGVAGAIALGGPGSIFWMWICALLGMGIKFAEASLAVRYRKRNAAREWIGGPMHMICNGLGEKWKPLAFIYCFFGVVAAFGVGNATQVNAIIGSVSGAIEAFGGLTDDYFCFAVGILLAVLTALMLSGGAKRIGQIAEKLIPYASVAYLILGLGVLVLRADMLGGALVSIVRGAFSPDAVTGGVVSSVLLSVRIGASRGIFTNEAGMGTASIAHASANVKHPAEQGLMGIMEVFIDTIVICTITALVILCSGVPIAYGTDLGASLTTDAFCAVYGQWVAIPIAVAVCCFAFATILGWGLYGLRCAQFLFGYNVWRIFVVCQVITVLVGAILNTGTVWLMSETINGLMAIPNLIALIGLTPELVKLTNEFQSGSLSADGGTNENFHQRKSVRTVPYAKVPSAGR